VLSVWSRTNVTSSTGECLSKLICAQEYKLNRLIADMPKLNNTVRGNALGSAVDEFRSERRGDSAQNIIVSIKPLHKLQVPTWLEDAVISHL